MRCSVVVSSSYWAAQCNEQMEFIAWRLILGSCNDNDDVLLFQRVFGAVGADVARTSPFHQDHLHRSPAQ